jgi:hypothetical protein
MQPGDALSDAALDRELERAFAIDPSPEFMARVRAQLADEPARTWRAYLSWPFAAAAAAAIVAAAIAVQMSNRSAVSPPAAPAQAARSTAPVVPARPAIRRRVSSERQPRVAPAVAAARGAAEPAALLDPRETQALRRLIDGVRTGRVELRPNVRASAQTVMELPPVTDIVIAPITIEPLAPRGAEGVRP